MSFLSDLKILYHLALKPVRGKDHAERLESFYAGQAGSYDEFRQRLLQGRQELFEALEFRPGDFWVDLGGGTGSNLEYVGDQIPQLRRVEIVDLSPSLLKVAEARAEARHWSGVKTCLADATQYQPDEPVDVVTFSYSLTMIPDWFAAIENALTMLRPGGIVGVVDFYVSRKYPAAGRKQHRWTTRSFWPIWFANDNVYPSSEHVPYLERRLDVLHLSEQRAKVPYLPLVRVPYYVLVGRKP